MKHLDKEIVKDFYKDISKLMRKKHCVPPRKKVIDKPYSIRYYKKDIKRAYKLLNQGYFAGLNSLLREALESFLDEWESVVGK
jgi:hypothetical protein